MHDLAAQDDVPRRLSRHVRQTRLRRPQARTSSSSAASAARAMRPSTSGGSTGSGAGDMPTLHLVVPRLDRLFGHTALAAT